MLLFDGLKAGNEFACGECGVLGVIRLGCFKLGGLESTCSCVWPTCPKRT